VLIHAPGGNSVLNVRTGAMWPAAPRETYWCQRDQAFVESPATGRVPHVGQLTSICDAAGKTAARLPRSVPSAVSAKGPGGLRLVSTADAVIAFRD
jgi:hypothetical protein